MALIYGKVYILSEDRLSSEESDLLLKAVHPRFGGLMLNRGQYSSDNQYRLCITFTVEEEDQLRIETYKSILKNHMFIMEQENEQTGEVAVEQYDLGNLIYRMAGNASRYKYDRVKDEKREEYPDFDEMCQPEEGIIIYKPDINEVLVRKFMDFGYVYAINGYVALDIRDNPSIWYID